MYFGIHAGQRPRSCQMVGALQRSSSMESAANRNPCNFEMTIMPKRHAKRSQISVTTRSRFGARDMQLPEHLVDDFAAFSRAVRMGCEGFLISPPQPNAPFWSKKLASDCLGWGLCI